MKYIINETGVVLFKEGKPTRIENTDKRYARVIAALKLPTSEQDAAVDEALTAVNINKDIESKGFSVNYSTGEVAYKGELLPTPLAQKVMSLIEQNLPVTLLERFWENLKLNPSYNSIRELYDFLAYKELPITEDGCFLAYRGLREDYYSVHGNTSTKVLQGTVNSQGHIYNGVGEHIEVARGDVDDDRHNHCSHGIHAGSYNYAKDWSRGKLVVVKINPKDVVSVPSDYNCQKLRCSAYTVINEIAHEIEEVATDENGEGLVDESYTEETAQRKVVIDRVDKYISRKRDQGIKTLTLKSIQSCFSPDCPSIIEIIDALNYLGLVWRFDGSSTKVVDI
jgi:hypothetical protein